MGWIWTYLRTAGDNFHEVVPGVLYRSATPSPENLEKWRRKYKIAVWLDLRQAEDFDGDRRTPTDKTRFFERQMGVCRYLGIERVWLPISDRRPTSDESVRSIMYTLERASTERPVLVACQGGRHRTGLAIALYRMRVQGWPATTPDKKGAFDESEKRGFYDRGHEEFGKRFRQLLGLLLVLLMAVPAFGQTVVFRGTGDNRSEYGTPSPDRNVICPACSDAGKKSTVRRWLGYSTTLSYSPSFNERTEARYWDEDGAYHDHELGEEMLVCSSGHRFLDYDDRRCWCGFPGDRYVVLDEVKGETITLPEGDWKKLLDHSNGITYTPNGAVITPVSYQHPFIQPDLTPTVKTAPKDYGVNHRFDRSYFLPFGLAVASSVTDWHSTYGGLSRGGREANPIFRSDQGRAVRWAANVVATAGFLGYTAWLEHRGHSKIARVLLYLLTTLRVAASIHNYSVRR